ncbi:MAG: DUF4367 domain-containing protein [Vallitaleaceae bacterium]|nr:DUF4367 domain-containing protein [Vallitaleaceae bacterium]
MDEKFLDSLCYQIGEAHVENTCKWLDGLKGEYKDLEYPKSLDTWFEKFIRERKKIEKKQQWKKRMKKVRAQAAMITLFLLIGGGVMTLSVEALRVRFLNFFVEVNDRYTEIRVEEAQEVQEVQENPEVFFSEESATTDGSGPSYVPEEYQLQETQSIGDMLLLKYTNADEQELLFTRMPNGGSTQIDTENAKVTEVTIHGNEGILSEKEGFVILFWHDQTYSYTLTGEVSAQTIIEVAESVR